MTLGWRALIALAAGSLIATFAPTAIAQATPVPDPDYSSYVTTYRSVNSGQALGQSFIATASGALSRVDLGLTDAASTGTLSVTLQTVNGSHMATGVVLASATVGNADIPYVPAFAILSVTFATPATVAAGTEYAIVLRSSDGDFGWADAASVYAGHPRVGDSGTGWQVLSSPVTASFAVYVATVNAGDGPGPVLQQVGLPASGTCSDVSSTSLNWGGVSPGGWGRSWAMWPNDGRGGGVCSRMLVYVPALSRWAVA